MQKTIKLVAVLVALGYAVTGCGGGGSMNSAGPKEVFVAFTERLSKKDFKGAGELATTESQFLLNMMEEKMKQTNLREHEKDISEEFKNIEIGDAKINGDLAVVPIKDKRGKFDIEFPLKKENGGWKVDFSMDAMKNMAEQESENMGDREHMDNMSPEDMKKMMNLKDSIMRNMDPEKLKEMQKLAEKIKEQEEQK